MTIPERLKRQAGRYALVDGIPFRLPVSGTRSPALMAMFTIDLDEATRLMPGNEIHPFRLWNKAVLIITVVDYRVTVIGKYVEFSVAIACTHGPKPAPPLLPALLMGRYGTGQYVHDLPVSSEVSVKGGKGIWGMPKHQANLDFLIRERMVSSQYDLDGQMVLRIEIERPKMTWLPINMGAINYCAFRGMLMKSSIYFKGSLGMSLFKKAAARLVLGDHPRVAALRRLNIGGPFFTAFFPGITGDLDDHYESWFLSYDTPPATRPEGMESVVNLGLSEAWLPPPDDPYLKGSEEDSKGALVDEANPANR